MKIKIRFNLYDFLFFLLLVLCFYFTRNALCRIMMVVFLGYTIFQLAVRKSTLRIPFFEIGFLLFILYGAANILLANVINTRTSQTMVISLFLNFLMIFAIVQYIYLKDDILGTLKLTEFGIFITAVAVVLLSIKTIAQGRLGEATEMNANMLAMLCVYGLVLSMYLRKIKAISKISSLFRLMFYILVVFLTGSRKGFIMIILAIFVVQFISNRKAILKTLLISLCVLVIFYILIMNVEILYNSIGVRMESLIKLLIDGTTKDGSLKSRQLLIKIGMAYIREKPWTGYGYDCFKLISGVNAGGSVGIGEVGYYSHNNYIELLFGGGIIGLILYYTPILHLFRKLLKLCKQHTCVPYLLAIMIAKLAIEYAYVSYYSRMDTYILAVILGCALIIPKRTVHDAR